MRKFYKYRGNVDLYSEKGLELFERDINMISNSEIWCSKLNDLNDPFEGEYNMDLFDKNLDKTTNLMSFLGLKKKSKDVNRSFSDSVKNLFKFSIQTRGIYSLTTDYKNDLMWSHYSNSHSGFCIEYEFDSLKMLDIKYKEHIPPNLNHFEKVNYSDKPFSLNKLNINFTDIEKFLFHKNIKWKYEEEWRIVTFISGKYTYNQNCIKSLTFGIKTPNETIKLIVQKLKHLNIEFYKMIKIDNYILEREKILPNQLF